MSGRLAAAIAMLATALGCGGGGERVVVGAKNFTEQRLLGELLAQTVESAGLVAVRRLDLGGTFVCDAALRAGQIDVYVEYTGTALAAILKEPPPATPAEVRAHVEAAYVPHGLVWMPALGFDNSFALVVRTDTPVATISEAVPLAAGWRAAFGYEFQERADGFQGLARAYGLAFREIRTMDLGLLYRALADRQVDVVAGNATDGPIEHLGLKVLADDRRYFPPYEAAPVARRAVLDRHPVLTAMLTQLGGSITAEEMRRMNFAVDGEHRDPATVVREHRARGGRGR
jgi:osmoprotectant transport system substrate-binding protein